MRLSGSVICGRHQRVVGFIGGAAAVIVRYSLRLCEYSFSCEVQNLQVRRRRTGEANGTGSMMLVD